MERFNLILQNDFYQKYLHQNKKCEKKRKFCLHDLQHFLDVARIAYIINLEKILNIEKDIIYATALLHDIGKWQQYKFRIPHEKASAELAQGILLDCGYSLEEINIITKAILEHRTEELEKSPLGKIIYQSDKLSRNCFACRSTLECNWDKGKKNSFIKY